MNTVFEYNALKSASNKNKHGIDFETAKKLWLDPNMLALEVRTVPEHRLMIIGKIANKHWSAIITYRQHRIRLISVRRSRINEVEFYEKNQEN